MKNTQSLIIAVSLAVFALSGCAGAPQSGLPATTAFLDPNGVPTDVGHELRAQAKGLNPICCVYVTESKNTSLLEYNYQAKGSPLCTLSVPKGLGAIQSDPKTELIVPQRLYVNVYKEFEHYCLSSIPSKQIDVEGALDAYSITGNVYYVLVPAALSNPPSVYVCNVVRDQCLRTLSNEDLYYPYAVTADKTGVYASGYSAGGYDCLIYWKGAAGAGTALYCDLFKAPGGIYFDAFGDLLAIDSTAGASALYVYSGCPSACKAHGPFSLGNTGQVTYGGLNRGDTQFMTVNTDGEIDVYQYNGIYGLTYLYKNTTGLNASLDPVGIAQQLNEL